MGDSQSHLLDQGLPHGSRDSLRSSYVGLCHVLHDEAISSLEDLQEDDFSSPDGHQKCPDMADNDLCQVIRLGSELSL